MTKAFQPVLLPLVLALPFAVTAAQIEPDQITTTDKVVVKAQAISENATETTITHEDIQRDLIHDARDLARYDPTLGVTDHGRFQRGFSLRGVEGNRVGITVDGISIPEYEENSLYSRYGNFNESRPYVDTEMVRGISVDRGASSLDVGSGALGGSVNYKTMEAADLVADGETFGALGRAGFSSKNKEWVQTVGAAWETERVSAILMYSHRHGHELESKSEGPYTQGRQSQHPDPSEHDNHSYLAKFRYKFTPEHSVGISLNGQIDKTDLDQRTYHLIGYEHEIKTMDDELSRHNARIDYTYEPAGDLLNKLVLSADVMKAETKATNYKSVDNRILYEWYPEDLKGDLGISLDDIDIRKFKTEFARLMLDAESAPIQFYGEHNLTLKVLASRKDFENWNQLTHNDTELSGAVTKVTVGQPYTIQIPVRTDQIAAVVNDSVYWEPDWFPEVPLTIGAHLGGRLDWTEHSPLSLNARLVGADPKKLMKEKVDFTNHAVRFGLDLTLADTWRAGYQVSTGFRNPTASEMWFEYQNPYGNWVANPDLKPETSISHTIFLSGDGYYGNVNLSIFKVDYDNFIVEHEFYEDGPLPYRLTMRNVEEATIKGIEASGRLRLGAFNNKLDGFSLMGVAGWSEGETNEGMSLLAIQPLKLIGGLDYEAPSGLWGIYSRVTYNQEKKPEDAKISNESPWDDSGNLKPGLSGPTKPFKYLSGDSTVFDLYGWWTPSKNVTIRAGIYNLTDEKYFTWDALRGIREFSVSNSVDDKGIGLERYHAPGRNASVSLEIRY